MSTKRLFIGNLAYSATEEEVLMHFGDYQPSNARVMADRGIAFIDIAEDQLAAAIEAMDGSVLKGRPIKVDEARPREDRPAGGGGGGRGGFGGGGGGGRGGFGGGGGGRDGGGGRGGFGGGGGRGGGGGGRGRDNGRGGGGGRGW